MRQLPWHRGVALARGELGLDRSLLDLVEIRARTEVKGTVHRAFVDALRSPEAPFLLAIGPEGAGRSTMLAQAAATVGLATLRIRCANLSTEPACLHRQVRAILREACMFSVLPLFENLDAQPAVACALERELGGFPRPVMASSANAMRITTRPVIVHRIEKPDVVARRSLWRELLGDASEEVIEAAAVKYTLWPGAIRLAAKNALAISTTDVTLAAVDDGVRACLGEQLEGLAKRVDWRQTWNDVVLPRDQLEQLIELAARVRHRAHVLETCGFGDKIGKGHGVAALFSGPPGTGKTMVAGLLAQELGIDLYQVDLSSVVSKYIGETEKQLAKLFDAAESGQAMILFDEADSLFAKRTQVKSSNDRYANLEVNYLLQRLEAFTGICLLTTNHEAAIDEAFRRRIAVHVRFPMPEERERAELWRSLLPAAAHVSEDIDPAELARNFELSGGYIKNAVLRAAYLAADQGTAISMTHLWRAARAEYESLGKIAHQRAA
ncbi:MAG: ATP-binding protein [Kofleriaceae bacterium]|nr:ATP-binding protein [Kofleriaceae bacterium]